LIISFPAFEVNLIGYPSSYI